MFKHTVMRKFSVLLLSAFTLSSFVFVFTSCDDDEPPAKPKLSFATSEITVKESDANLQIQVVLDKAASEDITIEYSLGGTAKDDIAAGSSLPADYEVVSDYLELEIPAGETTGVIELDFISDTDFEEDETIEISIEDVDSENIELTRDDEVNITVKQEDGLIVLLQWGIDANPAYTDVDMDLFLWAPNTSGVLVAIQYIGLDGTANTNLRSSTLSPEFFFLPTAIAEDGPLGISCAYWGGTKEPMDFLVSFIEIVNGDDVATEEKGFAYTLANINEWDNETTGTDLQLLVTFNKAGTDFKDFVALAVPTSGSRMGSSGEITMKKQFSNSGLPNSIKQFLKK
jgi:hypothetical protein